MKIFKIFFIFGPNAQNFARSFLTFLYPKEIIYGKFTKPRLKCWDLGTPASGPPVFDIAPAYHKAIFLPAKLAFPFASLISQVMGLHGTTENLHFVLIFIAISEKFSSSIDLGNNIIFLQQFFPVSREGHPMFPSCRRLWYGIRMQRHSYTYVEESFSLMPKLNVLRWRFWSSLAVQRSGEENDEYLLKRKISCLYIFLSWLYKMINFRINSVFLEIWIRKSINFLKISKDTSSFSQTAKFCYESLFRLDFANFVYTYLIFHRMRIFSKSTRT